MFATDALRLWQLFYSLFTGLSPSLALNESRQNWTLTKYCPVTQKCVKLLGCWTNTVSLLNIYYNLLFSLGQSLANDRTC